MLAVVVAEPTRLQSARPDRSLQPSNALYSGHNRSKFVTKPFCDD